MLKRFSFIGDGLSHVAFGTMAIAAVLLLRTGQNTKHGAQVNGQILFHPS
jgi:ABC-type Mn2+/Zn2+ transport system permease subunit